MTPDEREQMAILCERIAKEEDHHRFAEFVKQLNNLLEAKERRPHIPQSRKPSNALLGRHRLAIPRARD